MDVSTFLPAPCGEVSVQRTTNGGEMTFVDFMPQCIDPGGIFAKPTYETFRVLIDKSNVWLQSNPGWEVRTCESVEFKRDYAEVEREKMTYLQYKERATSYVRGLRLWLIPRMSPNNSAQQIGYLNLVPQKIGEPSFFGTASYEPLANVLERYNNWITTKPTTGRVINMECQEMLVNRQGDLDPDRSYWIEYGTYKQFLFILRVYFDITTPATEQIGVSDFLPNKISDGGICTFPTYEPFSNMVWKASEWCRQQNKYCICNVQSLNIKVKRNGHPNTQKMSYTEYNNRMTFSVRILRVFYTTPSGYSIGENPYHKTIHQLTCKTFVPVQTTSGLLLPEFESLSQTKLRVEAWVRATGAEVISSQTSALRLFGGEEARSGAESSSTYNSGNRENEYWIFVIRLYLNGSYYEPPSEMMPPIPEITDQCCCVIS